MLISLYSNSFSTQIQHSPANSRFLPIPVHISPLRMYIYVFLRWFLNYTLCPFKSLALWVIPQSLWDSQCHFINTKSFHFLSQFLWVIPFSANPLTISPKKFISYLRLLLVNVSLIRLLIHDTSCQVQIFFAHDWLWYLSIPRLIIHCWIIVLKIIFLFLSSINGVHPGDFRWVTQVLWLSVTLSWVNSRDCALWNGMNLQVNTSEPLQIAIQFVDLLQFI